SCLSGLWPCWLFLPIWSAPGAVRLRRYCLSRRRLPRRSRVNFWLTRQPPASLFGATNRTRCQYSSMKTSLALSMLLPLAILCSCQKQDSSVEQQLAQRQAQLDAREKALDEREKALAARERALTTQQMPSLDAKLRALRDSAASGQTPSIPSGLIPDNTRLKAERERRLQERIAERQRRLESLQRMRRQLATETVSPNAQSSPAIESAPSVNPEAASPTPSPATQ